MDRTNDETHDDGEPDYTTEPLDDAPTANPYALAPLEPPARTTGWRHLPPERWAPERIHVAPYNAKIRRLPPAKLLRLRRGLLEFGWAGTFIVRAEDGMLIGGAQRYALALDVIRERGRDRDEMARLNLGTSTGGQPGEMSYTGPSLAVSPVLGIPDAKALALNVLLNNREAQGEFAPMGLAEALSELDAHGFDVTETGYDLEQVAALVTWEADETKQGGAKASGAEPATKRGAKEETPPAIVLPCTRADVETVLEAYEWAPDDHGGDHSWRVDPAVVARVRALLELPASVLPLEPPLDFGTPAPAPGTTSPDVTPTPADVSRDAPVRDGASLGARIWLPKS